MLPHERQEKIMDLLLKNETCSIEEFSELFPKVSESTIRRDLKLLESENRILLFHGGDVQLKRNSYESAFESKKKEDRKTKVLLAEFAAQFIKNGDTVYLDSSTTVIEMLPFIKKEITLVTNYSGFAPFEDCNYPVIKIGGQVRRSSLACFDAIARENIKLFNFDLSIVGCGGIHEEYGITYPSYEQALYEQQLRAQSQKFMVLAAKSKFSNVFTGKAFQIDECEIYTDEIPPGFRHKKTIFTMD